MTGSGPSLLDLTDARLWSLLLATIVLVAPMAHAPLRRAALAALFLLAILMLLGAPALAAAIIVVVGTAAVARLTAAAARAGRGTVALVLSWLGVLAVLTAFALHKLAAGPLADRMPTAAPALAAIGFSYVALRVIDLLRTVAEGRQPPPGLVDAALYLVPLHMLVVGPIQSFDAFAHQPPVPTRLAPRRALEAVERVVGGLFKTFVLAGLIEAVALTGFRAQGPYLLAELQLHYLWVYLEFSGLSDVAVGLGTLLGLATPENFDRPLGARNLTVFWERWHISLSEFVRRHLFIPVQLAGARRVPRHPLWVASIAFLIAFAVCGLWHALTPIFLLWGLYHGIGLVIVNAYRYALKKRLGRAGMKRYLANRPLRWLATAITFEFVAISLAGVLHPHLLGLPFEAGG